MQITGYKRLDLGKNNIIFLPEEVGDFEQISKKTHFKILGENNAIFIARGASFDDCLFIMGSGGVLVLGASRYDGMMLRTGADSVLFIGQHNYFNPFGKQELSAISRRHLFIGDECFFSYPITVDNSDFHLIFDAQKRRINSAKSVIIGDRVWLGRGVSVLKGAVVGSGAVVGARSVVSAKIPSNAMAVGVPAKIVRQNIVWSGKTDADFSLDEQERTADFTGLDHPGPGHKMSEPMSTNAAEAAFAALKYECDDKSIAKKLLSLEFITRAQAAEYNLKSGQNGARFIVVLDSGEERLAWVLQNVYMDKNKNRFAWGETGFAADFAGDEPAAFFVRGETAASDSAKNGAFSTKNGVFEGGGNSRRVITHTTKAA